MTGSGGPLVEVDDLRVHFPLHKRGMVVHAVDGVSFSIGRGEVFGLIGESGSGKSTVGRAVMQLLEPTDGDVRFDGVSLVKLGSAERKRIRRRVQMVFQDSSSALDPRMTIRASMREPLEIQGAERAGIDHTVNAIMHKVGLDPALGGRYPHELSGGQKQRVNIARALVLDPDMLVCDEAVSALDVSLQAEVLNLFTDLGKDLGLAYLFIGHDLTVVAHVADRIGVMYLGKLMEVGPTDDVMERPAHPYTFALRSAEPEVVLAEDRSRQRILLTGDIPSPIEPPPGCVFHTRCPFAEPICRQQVPEWRQVAPDRWVACHLASSTGEQVVAVQDWESNADLAVAAPCGKPTA